jgi:ribosomal protein S18 acetylase RimI-like enzyme
VATEADLEAVAAIHVASFRGTYELRAPEFVMGLDAVARAEVWRERLRSTDGRLVVATSDTGAVVGFCWFGPTTDVDDPPDRVGQVRSIHVAPSLIGQGHGRALLRTVLDDLAANGCAEATLWVVTTNERAQAVYRRDGWQPDGARRTEPLGLPGEAAPEVEVVRMRRSLAGRPEGGT